MANFEGIVNYNISLKSYNTANTPTMPFQLLEENKSNKIIKENITNIKYPLYYKDTKLISTEVWAISIKFLSISLI